MNKKILCEEISCENMMVGSHDVESLYPSMKTKKAGELARDRITESSMKFEGVDYRWAVIYLTLTIHVQPRKD